MDRKLIQGCKTALAMLLLALSVSCGGGAGNTDTSSASPITAPGAGAPGDGGGGGGGAPTDPNHSDPTHPDSGPAPDSGTDVAGPGTGSGGTGVDPGGVGSGGTGVTAGLNVGSIDGFGSVIVNGIRYNIDHITPQIEDANALALGMTVQIGGPYDELTMEGTATSLVSAAELRGKITAIDAPTSRLWVYGSPAEADAATVVVGATNFAALAVGDEVQIHGLPSNGPLAATRIERLAQATLPIVTGAVTGLNTTQSSFRLAGLEVQYAGASFSGFGSTQLTNGTVVRVRSDAVPVAGVLLAQKVQRWISVPQTGTSGLAITGLMESFTSVSETFVVAGVTIDARATKLKDDVLKALHNGATIYVTGVYSGGVLTAGSIKIVRVKGAPAAPTFSLSGPVQNHVSASNFKVQGQLVDASAAAFSGGGPGKLGQTKPPKVKVVGTKLVGGVLIADTVSF